MDSAPTPCAPGIARFPVLEYRPVRPPPSTAMRRFLARNNPFFLLSGLSMLFGIFALNNSLTWSPLPQYNLLLLILMLNGYELLLVGLGIVLIRRGLTRDGAILLALEAVFLSDLGFLNSEIFTADLSTGLVVNAFLLMLAGVKLAIVFRGLGLSWRRDARFALIFSQMLFLLGAPGYFRNVVNHHHGVLPEFTVWGVWWLLGIMLALSAPFLRAAPHAQGRLIGTFIYVPMLSIIAHLCAAGWVYHTPWHWNNFAPLLLGWAVMIGTSDPHVRRLAMRMRLQLLLPVAAVLFSLEDSPALTFTLAGVAITPIRAALLGVIGVYLIGVLMHRHPSFLVGAIISTLLICMGHDSRAMSDNAEDLLVIIGNELDALVPATLKAWGLICVIAAFALLGIGVRSSLRKQTDPPPDG